MGVPSHKSFVREPEVLKGSKKVVFRCMRLAFGTKKILGGFSMRASS